MTCFADLGPGALQILAISVDEAQGFACLCGLTDAGASDCAIPSGECPHAPTVGNATSRKCKFSRLSVMKRHQAGVWMARFPIVGSERVSWRQFIVHICVVLAILESENVSLSHVF